MTNKKSFSKIKPYTRYWETEANALLREAYGTPVACRKCGHPVLAGYCCTTCGDNDPTAEEE